MFTVEVKNRGKAKDFSNRQLAPKTSSTKELPEIDS